MFFETFGLKDKWKGYAYIIQVNTRFAIYADMAVTSQLRLPVGFVVYVLFLMSLVFAHLVLLVPLCDTSFQYFTFQPIANQIHRRENPKHDTNRKEKHGRLKTPRKSKH